MDLSLLSKEAVKVSEHDKKLSFVEPLWLLRNGFTPAPLDDTTHWVNLKEGVALVLRKTTPYGVAIAAITDRAGRLLVEGKKYGTTINVPDLFKIGEWVESQKILTAYPSHVADDDDDCYFQFIGPFCVNVTYDAYARSPINEKEQEHPFRVVCSNNIGHEKWDKDDLRDFPNKAKKEGYEYLPVFYFSHGDTAVKTKPFTGPHAYWDSGQVGWIFVEPATGREEWGRKWRKMARDYMETAVEEWDSYLRGDKFFVEVLAGDDRLDSCGGYIGDKDYALEEGISTALCYLKTAVKEQIELHHLLERSDELNAHRSVRMHEHGLITKEEKNTFIDFIRAQAAYHKASEAIGAILDEKYKRRIEDAQTQQELRDIHKEMTMYPECVEKTLLIRSLLMKGDGLKQ